MTLIGLSISNRVHPQPQTRMLTMDAFTAGNSEHAIARAVSALRDPTHSLSDGGQVGQLARSRGPHRRPGAYARDYGPQRTTPDMEPKRLPVDSGGHSSGDSGSSRQGSLVYRAAIRFRAEMRAMCPGTRVFYWCVLAASVIEIARVI